MKDYAHFWAQGMGPSKDRTCPLWSGNTKVHDTEVAKAAEEGRQLLEEKNMKLKHDPTKDAPTVANQADGGEINHDHRAAAMYEALFAAEGEDERHEALVQLHAFGFRFF